MAHRLGFAVKVLGDGGLPSHDARRSARASAPPGSASPSTPASTSCSTPSARFEAGLEQLGERARARLVIENDDRVYALEAKAKDVALLRLREQLLARGFGWERGYLSSATAAP